MLFLYQKMVITQFGKKKNEKGKVKDKSSSMRINSTGPALKALTFMMVFTLKEAWMRRQHKNTRWTMHGFTVMFFLWVFPLTIPKLTYTFKYCMICFTKCVVICVPWGSAWSGRPFRVRAGIIGKTTESAEHRARRNFFLASLKGKKKKKSGVTH